MNLIPALAGALVPAPDPACALAAPAVPPRGAAGRDAAWPERERQATLRLLERWVPTVFAGRRVLEVGAGSGHWTRFIAPQAASMLATDRSAKALDLARSRVRGGRVAYALADTGELPPPGFTGFDAAFAGFWWSRTPQPQAQAALQGLPQRLQPGAKVMLLDHRLDQRATTPSEPELRRWLPSADEFVHREWGALWTLTFRLGSAA